SDTRSFESLTETGVPSPLPPLDGKAPAAIFFTSGSTGPAKGVNHSVASLGAMFASTLEGYDLGPRDVMLPASSCSHLGGFPLPRGRARRGRLGAGPPRLHHAELGPLMRLTRPTVMTTLPAALFHLIRERDTVAADFGSVRFCRSGGDKVPAELEAEFTALTG